MKGLKRRKSGTPTVKERPNYRRASEKDLYEIVYLFFVKREPVARIARDLKWSRPAIIEMIRRAYRDNLITLPLAAATKLAENLQSLFSGVKFHVILAKSAFSRLAAEVLSEWITVICDSILQSRSDKSTATGEEFIPYVTLGGGTTMSSIIDEVPNVLGRERHDLRDWFRSHQIRFVNATSGIRPTQPALSSFFLACLWAKHTQQEAELFFMSPQDWHGTKAVNERAVCNSCVVISSIGTVHSHCWEAMDHYDLFDEKTKRERVGELLYHPFDARGNLVTLKSGGIEVTENVLQEEKLESQGHRASARRTTRSSKLAATPPPALATLLGFDSLRGRPAKNAWINNPPRSVIGVANCDDKNREQKAVAAYALLRSNVFTHFCVSADLADAIVAQSRMP